MTRILTLTILLALSIACSDGGGGGGTGVGGTTNTNKFTMTGSTALTVDAITSSKSASTTYYGRALMASGGNLYGASFHFTLNKNTATTAYFSDFFLDRFVTVTAYNSATAQVTSSTNLSVTASYNATTNGLSITNATSRFVGFNINFGNTTYLQNISNAAVMFSNDFTTMVGGDNSTFFFIAQKASSMPNATSTDTQSSWGLANFTVSNSGNIAVSSTSTVNVSGTGGNGLVAFKGTSSDGTTFQGESSMTDAGTGLFMFGFDGGSHATPTADGRLDGAFLLSPDKSYMLGYDKMDGIFFAGSR